MADFGLRERAAHILREQRDAYRKHFPPNHQFSPNDAWAYSLNAVERALKGDWRPIETAPETVERCFLWCSDLIRDAPKGVVMGRVIDGEPYGDGMCGDWSFTHWRPIFDAPEAS